MSFKATEMGPSTAKTAAGSGTGSGTSSGIASEATQWLTYWVVFSSLTVMEGVFPFVVEYVPMYYACKVAIIVWLYHPKTTGAEVVYTQIIKPYILPLLESTKTTKTEVPVVKKSTENKGD